MKKICLLLIYVFTFLPFLFADDCSDFLADGKQNYNNGNYKKAKECFVYVKNECGASYGDVTNWIKKCDDALMPKLSVSKLLVSCSASATTEYITVTSNTAWDIQRSGGSMYSVTRSGNTLTIRVTANTTTQSREDYFYVKTTDGSISKKITLKQSGKVISNSSTSAANSTSSTLSISQSYIYSSYDGSTRYLTVTSNTEWEVLYATGSMYSVTRSGNQLTIRINYNSSNTSRKDFFKVKTKDGSKEVKVTIEQGANSSAKATSSGKTKKTTSYNSGLTAYQKYIQNWGITEATWIGFNTSLCTGYEFGISFLGFRYGWLQVNIYKMAVGVDFLTGEGYFAYNPSVNFLIPTGYDGTLYFGGGPSLNTSYDVWFNTEFGYRWHWGDYASSDFFMRYDGTFTVGLSIQWSSYF